MELNNIVTDQKHVDPTRTRLLLVILAITAVLTNSMVYRLRTDTRWLIQPPLRIKSWTAMVVPLSSDYLNALGNPKTDGWSYSNPLGEQISIQVISNESFDAYRNPPVISQFYYETKHKIQKLTSGEFRLTFWRSRQDAVSNVVMATWLQRRNKTTRQLSSSGELSIADRLSANIGHLLHPTTECLVRAYLPVSKADTNAEQATRSLTLMVENIQAYGRTE